MLSRTLTTTTLGRTSRLVRGISLTPVLRAPLERSPLVFSRGFASKAQRSVVDKVELHVQGLSGMPNREEHDTKADEKSIALLSKQVPDHFLNCRGCGSCFQSKDEGTAGYVPRHHLLSFLQKTKLQLEASKQDLRIRSGGGKGQGTAVAALHASLKASLVEAHDDATGRLGKGAFQADRLQEMGLDFNMNPLPRIPEYDEQGRKIHVVEPEEVPLVYNQFQADKNKFEKEKKLRELMRDPNAAPEDIAALKKVNVRPEVDHQKIDKTKVLNLREVKMLEKAAKNAAKPLKCMRCHQLTHNAVAQGEAAGVRAEDFVALQKNEFQGKEANPSVIIKVVDFFDFHGSFIANFQKIAGGKNPIILAVNKFDVIPTDIGFNTLYRWVENEVKKYNLNIQSIALISARTGFGVDDMMRRALKLARGGNDQFAPKNRDVYVVGSTNVGKSTLVNYLLRNQVVGTGLPSDTAGAQFDRKRVVLDNTPVEDAEESAAVLERTEPEELGVHPLSLTSESRDDPNVNKVVADIETRGVSLAALDAVIPNEFIIKHHQQLLAEHAGTTTSPIPGTTLGITSFPILEKKRGGRNLKLKDTPGVLNAHQLSSYLHYDELKAVLPTRKLVPQSYRLKTGQSILFGGLCRVDMIGGRPYNVGCFTAPKVTVQIASTHNITAEYIDKHLGTLLLPPYDPIRADDLHVYDYIAVSEEESDALRELQKVNREESTVSMQRQKQLMGLKPNDRVHPDEYEDLMTKSLEPPRTGHDRAAALRIEGKTLTDEMFKGLVAVEKRANTRLPARSFIDSQGRVVFQLQGSGWREVSHDIMIAGLGWICVTGSGPLTLRISLAGEKFQFTEEEMRLTSIAANDIDIGNMNSGLPANVRRAYSRTIVRDPLVPTGSLMVDKFVGTPEALKKKMGYQIENKREELMRQRYAKHIPELEEEEEEEDDVDMMELFKNPEAAVKRRGVTAKLTKQTGILGVEEGYEGLFDVYKTPEPLPPRVREPKNEEEEDFKMIEQWKAKRLQSTLDKNNLQLESGIGQEEEEESEFEFKDEEDKYEFGDHLNEAFEEPKNQPTSSPAPKAMNNRYSMNNDHEEDDIPTTAEQYMDPSAEYRLKKNSEKLMRKQGSLFESRKNAPPPPPLDDDMMDEAAYDELERIAADLGLDGVEVSQKDVESLQRQGQGFEKFHSEGVPTGPAGKKEKGGRRARAAMGLAERDRFADKNYLDKRPQGFGKKQ